MGLFFHGCEISCEGRPGYEAMSTPPAHLTEALSIRCTNGSNRYYNGNRCVIQCTQKLTYGLGLASLLYMCVHLAMAPTKDGSPGKGVEYIAVAAM